MAHSQIGWCSAHRGALLAAFAMLAGILEPACQQTPLPGTMLGRYKVIGQSTANSCGAKLHAPNPWVFDAELSREGSTMYWSWLDGSAPLSGSLSASTVTLSTSQAANVDPIDGAIGPCLLQRRDDLAITLGAGSPPTVFDGTITYTFTVPSGSSCGDQLVDSGGTYAALPCTIAYSLGAARR